MDAIDWVSLGIGALFAAVPFYAGVLSERARRRRSWKRRHDGF